MNSSVERALVLLAGYINDHAQGETHAHHIGIVASALEAMNRTPAGMSEPDPHMDGVFSVKNGEWRARVGGVLQAAVWGNYEDAWAAYKARKHASPAPEGAGMSEPDERAAFEKWARHMDLRPSIVRDMYLDMHTQFAWCGWKARADLTPPAVFPEPARQSVLDEVRRAIRALWGVAPGPHAILDLADVESVIDRLAAPAAVREPAPSYPAVPPSEEKKP